MRGRKPKPTYLLLDGNPGRQRPNSSEPELARRAPTCPSHLCPPAKAEWKRLAARLTGLRILTELDRAALAAYCQAYGRWVEAERKLHETPMLRKASLRLCAAKPMAHDRKQAARLDAQISERVRPFTCIAIARFPSRPRYQAMDRR